MINAHLVVLSRIQLILISHFIINLRRADNQGGPYTTTRSVIGDMGQSLVFGPSLEREEDIWESRTDLDGVVQCDVDIERTAV